MTENEFFKIRESVFANIAKSNKEKAQLEEQIEILRQKQERKLAEYDEMEQAKDVEARRGLVQEQYNLSILTKQSQIKNEEAYMERAQVYFQYIIALHSNNKKDMKVYKEKFLEVIQKQALEECNTSISIIQQKRIAANKLNKCVELNPSIQKDGEVLVTKKELDNERMVQFDLEDEQKMMKSSFKKDTPLLTDALMRNQKICDMPPFNSIKEIYPNIREQVAVREEKRGKVA